jgi:hypothetical protein
MHRGFTTTGGVRGGVPPARARVVLLVTAGRCVVQAGRACHGAFGPMRARTCGRGVRGGVAPRHVSPPSLCACVSVHSHRITTAHPWWHEELCSMPPHAGWGWVDHGYDPTQHPILAWV